jgi:hypothetical protein
MTDEKTTKGQPLGCMILLAGLVPLGLLRGWCVALHWRWFVAEPFALPEIGILHGWGLSSLVALVAWKFNAAVRELDPDRVRAAAQTLLNSALVSLSYAGFGWVIYWLMVR